MMTSRRSRSSRSRSGVFVGDVGLGLRMQNNKESGSSGSNKRVMVMSCHDHDEAEAVVVLPHHDQLSSSSCSACSCGDGGSSGGGPAAAGGPMFYGCTSNNHVACFGDINDVVASVSASSGSGGIDARAVVLSKSLQYHHPFNSDSSSLFTFNSSGEMTSSVNERSVLFTAAQWQELERQTMIYKYMMASVPVPPELLLPFIKNQSNMILPSQSNMLTGSRELGVPSFNSSDPEPWRCKRTDGKKWRCSRDVAPDQKYCERHSHKSRPRSRKPVELQAHDSMRTITNTNTNTTTNNNNYSTNSHLFDQKSNFPNHLFMLPGSYDQPRSLEWLLKGETSAVASNSSQEWQHLKRESIKLGGDDKMYDFHREEQQRQLSSNSYRGGGHSLQAQRLNDHCSLLLSPTSTTLERALNPPNRQAAAQETRHFIDAWSTSGRENNIGNKSSVSSTDHHKLLPHPALTLSMSGCGGSETKNHQGNENASQVGGRYGIDIASSSSISESRDHHQTGSAGLRSQWMMMMNHGGSGSGPWMMSSPPGGPLAEALCLGISSIAKTTTSNLESPCSSNSDQPNINKN